MIVAVADSDSSDTFSTADRRRNRSLRDRPYSVASLMRANRSSASSDGVSPALTGRSSSTHAP
jgi:hypothetical protein